MIKKLLLGLLLVSTFAAGSYGVTQAISSKVESCCCDFSNGKIVCRITGQELPECCCK